MGNLCNQMGSGASVADKKYITAQQQVNKDIEKELQEEKRKKVLKLLLLGPGESGKSTTLKQIRIIHDSGFTAEEKVQKKFIVYSNLIQGLLDIIEGLDRLKIPFDKESSQEHATQLVKYSDKNKMADMSTPDDYVYDAISKLLDDAVVIEASVSPEVGLDESCRYFLQNFSRIRQNDYIPTEEDILMSRVPTSGVVQLSFFIKNYTFRVFDVGGQKAQRRKWIHIFDDVHAVLFITSLSEYNQTLAEDGKVNRMQDSIELFGQICNNEWFSNTAIILFLNKIDLFQEKIKHFPITIALKNYKGKQEYRPALDYITRKYKQVNKNKKRNLYMHETCATDTKQIQVVIDSVIDVVIQQTMQKVGIQ